MKVKELIKILKDIEQTSGDCRIVIDDKDIAMVYVKVNNDEEDVVEISCYNF